MSLDFRFFPSDLISGLGFKLVSGFKVSVQVLMQQVCLGFKLVSGFKVSVQVLMQQVCLGFKLV